MKDDLGTRMKTQYEQRSRTFLPRRTYTIIRLDGKAFHTFTRGMERPYDQIFIDVMDKTAMFLASEIQGCKMAYVQSDEISLLLTDFSTITTDAWFDGNVQKMVSVSASMAAAQFNQLFYMNAVADKLLDANLDSFTNWPTEIFGKIALFDARVFTIPDPVEVENYFIWRQKDAVRNSLAMHAQSLFSHKELNGKSQADMHDMIHAKGENWDKLPDGFKRGRTIKYDLPNEPDWTQEHPDLRQKWMVFTPDFLKEREDLSDLIPIYEENR